MQKTIEDDTESTAQAPNVHEADGNAIEKIVVEDKDKIFEYTLLFKGNTKTNVNL